MSVTSLKYKTKLGTLTAPGDVDPGAMTPIATVAVGAGGASTIDFTSIPDSYEHLQLRLFLRNTETVYAYGYVAAKFNNDSGANYTGHRLYGTGASPYADVTVFGTVAASNMEFGWTVDAKSGYDSRFGVSVVDILDYKNTAKHKTVRSLTGYDTNVSTAADNGQVGIYSSHWRSNDAINRITLYTYAGTYAQYSHAALYGVKKAGA